MRSPSSAPVDFEPFWTWFQKQHLKRHHRSARFCTGCTNSSHCSIAAVIVVTPRQKLTRRHKRANIYQAWGRDCSYGDPQALAGFGFGCVASWSLCLSRWRHSISLGPCVKRTLPDALRCFKYFIVTAFYWSRSGFVHCHRHFPKKIKQWTVFKTTPMPPWSLINNPLQHIHLAGRHPLTGSQP